MRNFLILLLLASCWSPSFLFMKVGLRDFGPISLAWYRTLLASVALLIVLAIQGHSFRQYRGQWRHFFFLGLVGSALPFVCFTVGEQWIESALASIVNSLTPIMTIIFAHYLSKDEPFTLPKLSGIAIGFAGILLLTAPKLEHGILRNEQLWGILAVIGATCGYGLSAVYVRRHLRQTSTLAAPAFQLGTAALWLTPAAFLFEQPLGVRPALFPLFSVAALALWGTAFAMVIFYRLLGRTSATFASLVTYLVPVGGIILGWLVLNEHIGVWELVGCALILLGVMAVQRHSHPVSTFEASEF